MPFLGNGDCTITEARQGDVSSSTTGGILTPVMLSGIASLWSMTMK